MGGLVERVSGCEGEDDVSKRIREKNACRSDVR